MQSDLQRMDFIERADGPPLVALWGGEEPESRYRLGTREYDWHSHVRGQVFCVESGLVHVRTSQGSWLLPPHRAGWIPPGEEHWASVSGATSGWSVVVAPEQARQLPDRPCVFGISELMRALVRRAVAWTMLPSLSPEQQRILQVLLDEIARAPHEPLHLPMPSDPRLARIARAVLSEPGSTRTLEQWATWGAVSARTLRRLMQAETGLGFAAWRQQVRLTHALEMLACGEPVATIADALNYASPSNFIAMFRRAFGESPARYFSGRGPRDFEKSG
ncbi:helix-turn-helix transcriptional regulator [Labrys sp. ZIDIC5]|uniref:AraC family transcriptional regulator n=1 Tax=Labrys sedimenti TaxID=3106036 RepID=UPI002ACABD21|nr:helix-turn-helix transcriptional regulator [Labrys sp. ZIDIC5]MDZ5452402.1 helix-turn-helix transcriptional regulator [Labrys sp. ZIDIC5]